MEIDKIRLKQALKKACIATLPYSVLQLALLVIAWLFVIPGAITVFCVQIILFTSFFRYQVEKAYGSYLDFSRFEFFVFVLYGHVLGLIYYYLGSIPYHSPATILTYGIIYYLISECVKNIKK